MHILEFKIDFYHDFVDIESSQKVLLQWAVHYDWVEAPKSINASYIGEDNSNILTLCFPIVFFLNLNTYKLAISSSF